MRIEIVRELDLDDDQLEIPWTSPSGSALRYVDLKRFPEKIRRLPECRGYPALGALLSKVNAPGSNLRTAKCDVWKTTELAQDERLDFKLPFKTGGYVDLVFERAELRARLGAHLRFGKKLARALRRFPVQGQMEIVVRRCLFHPPEVRGYALTLFVHAYGTSRTEAKAEWGRALAALGDALSQTSPRGPPFSRKGAVRSSPRPRL